jgi:hypothetical protein
MKVDSPQLIAPEERTLMTNTNERAFVPSDEMAPQVDTVEHAAAVDLNGLPGDEVNGAWRTEAGRKGAKRVHQLIEAGKRYEEEHGLKSGRQRLRQLIELGKLYEQEHGIRPVVKRRKGRRLSKMERDEVIATLFGCLTRMVKPSFRPELERLAEALKVET